jgi:AraC-like DNA-binding protein
MPALNQAQAISECWTSGPGRGAATAPIGRINLVPFPSPGDKPRQEGLRAERRWREPPGRYCPDSSRILTQRWKEAEEGVREYAKVADPRFAVLGIALRPTRARFTVDGECVHEGTIPASFAALTAAGRAESVEFHGPCDFLHLFVPSWRLAEIAAQSADLTSPADLTGLWLSAADPVIERLAWLLLRGGEDAAETSELYLDGIALAIVSRLFGCSRSRDAARGLVKWRLKRVQDFIEEQLAERLSLADLARSAGLSRMHFAAQFRAATGMRPHEYLVRRRIQKAQEMLLTTSMPLVEVALSVGFQTQAHFTTVFRRFLGETPGRWREAQRLA